MPVVTGISDHIGWAELVTVATRDGLPAILDRRRAELIEAGLPSAPYHHEGLAMPLDEVEPIIFRTRRSVLKHCRSLLGALRSSFHIDAIVIPESPYRELPDSVREVLESYALTCAADGMLYREGLASEASGMGLDVHRTPRKFDAAAAASRALRCPASEVTAILAGFGKSVGVPWRKEHREAAAAALCVLAGSTDFNESRRR